MACPRCHGFMVSDGFEASRIDSGEPGFSGWRCVNCGELIDSIIVSNRRRTPARRETALSPTAAEVTTLAA